MRALFVTGGNPLITMPNGNRLRQAFGELDLLVTLDIFRMRRARWRTTCSRAQPHSSVPICPSSSR